MYYASPSPALLLARRCLQEIPPGLWIISGARGAGKTSWCTALVDQARQIGLSVSGILCPAVFADGQKIGIDLVEIRNGKRYRLGMRRNEDSGEGTYVGCWRFDEQVLAWGNRILQELDPSDLVIIDELGPLELQDNNGLLAGLNILDEHIYRTAFVVIRPELLGLAQTRWPEAQVLEIHGGEP
jgi:nucleoside-triphosphatase